MNYKKTTFFVIKNWWNQTYYIEKNDDETGILRLAVVMSYFTIVCKVFKDIFFNFFRNFQISFGISLLF